MNRYSTDSPSPSRSQGSERPEYHPSHRYFQARYPAPRLPGLKNYLHSPSPRHYVDSLALGQHPTSNNLPQRHPSTTTSCVYEQMAESKDIAISYCPDHSVYSTTKMKLRNTPGGPFNCPSLADLQLTSMLNSCLTPNPSPYRPPARQYPSPSFPQPPSHLVVQHLPIPSPSPNLPSGSHTGRTRMAIEPKVHMFERRKEVSLRPQIREGYRPANRRKRGKRGGTGRSEDRNHDRDQLDGSDS